MSSRHDIVIIGGGTAGITVAAQLVEHARASANSSAMPDIAIIEPSDKHYYQPIWTLVGGGVFDREVSVRAEADFIPDGVTWIRDRAEIFQPEQNAVITGSGDTIHYEVLIVAPGIQLDWGEIRGLRQALGTDGVCSNYSYDTVETTWRFLREMDRGNAVFTFPATPIKCAGAPQKIMWLAEHHLRRRGVRD
ncbi:MAG: FAD/NAD(P)-binding oxidoreductase, partial [Myxococcota bacterium]